MFCNIREARAVFARLSAATFVVRGIKTKDRDQAYQLIEYIKRIKRFKNSIVNILYEFYLFRSLSIKVTYHFDETGEGVPCAEFLIYTITS